MRQPATAFLVLFLAASLPSAGCALVGGLGDFVEVDCAGASCGGEGGAPDAAGPDGTTLTDAGVDGGGPDGSRTDAAIDSGPPSTGLVVAELYASGSKSGQGYERDYVVLKNIGSAPVDVTGWSLQHNKTGVGWVVLPLTATSIPAAGTYLIRLYYDGGATAGSALPAAALAAPDVSAWNLSTSNGEAVAVVRDTTALTSCTSSSIVDLVGWVAGAPCFEGTGVAPTSSPTQSAQRKNGRTQDTNDNVADFELATASP